MIIIDVFVNQLIIRANPPQVIVYLAPVWFAYPKEIVLIIKNAQIIFVSSVQVNLIAPSRLIHVII